MIKLFYIFYKKNHLGIIINIFASYKNQKVDIYVYMKLYILSIKSF